MECGCAVQSGGWWIGRQARRSITSKDGDRISAAKLIMVSVIGPGQISLCHP